jgi:hypothetical protein
MPPSQSVGVSGKVFPKIWSAFEQGCCTLRHDPIIAHGRTMGSFAGFEV